jgi:hypothetical protein
MAAHRKSDQRRDYRCGGGLHKRVWNAQPLVMADEPVGRDLKITIKNRREEPTGAEPHGATVSQTALQTVMTGLLMQTTASSVSTLRNS